MDNRNRYDSGRFIGRNSNRESIMTLELWIAIGVVSVICWGMIIWELINSPTYDDNGRPIEKGPNHDLHYNSLDPNSPYSERECKGESCGCHTDKKEVDMKSSGDM